MLDKLFRRRQAPSKLATFLAELQPNSIREASMRGEDQEVRVASAVSLLTLAVANGFAAGVIKTATEMAKATRGRAAPEAIFDVVAFEAAAFGHNHLLAPFLDAPFDDDDDSEVGIDGNPYCAVVRTAAQLSGSLLLKYTNFDLPHDFFMNRVSSYSMPGRQSQKLATFEGILSAAINGNSPKAGLKGPISLDLALTRALKSAAPAFGTHSLPALEHSARMVFDNAGELGLGDRAGGSRHRVTMNRGDTRSS